MAILKGQATGADMHSEVVAVGDEGSYFCSGVLISPTLVLTARHCLPVSRVLFGADLKTAERVIATRHTETAPDENLDAALLTLREASSVRPACFLTPSPHLPRELRLRLVGFGAAEETGQRGFGRRRLADLGELGWRCTPRQARQVGCDPATESAVLSTDGKDTCDGDSGGALYAAIDSHLWLVGITSRAIRNVRVRCGRGGVYTRIDALSDWLLQRIAKETQATK